MSLTGKLSLRSAAPYRETKVEEVEYGFGSMPVLRRND